MKKETGAYFTVEAAMIFPMVLFTIVLVIYLQFFQYNRCLMEQDMGILLLRGAALQAEDNEDRVRQLKEQASGLYSEKYIAWDNGEIVLKLEKGKISVKKSGQLRFPFSGEIFGRIQVWMTTAAYENHIISPVSFVRSYRKLSGGE